MCYCFPGDRVAAGSGRCGGSAGVLCAALFFAGMGVALPAVTWAALVAEATGGHGASNAAAAGGQDGTPTAIADEASIVAEYALVAPIIDGVLDDAVWRLAQPVTEFRQRNPVAGAIPSEATEVRIAFDAENIYFGFMFYDSEPDDIIAQVLQREGRIDLDDRVIIGLDSYDDDRSAYIFELNALGTQGDALITDERIVFSDWNWEGIYHSEGIITDAGWALEVAIPFTTIRFNDVQEPRMGVAFYRSIRRKNEELTWPYISQRFRSGIFQVSQYGALLGLRNVERGRNVEIKPFGVIGGQRTAEAGSDFLRDVGVDMKIGLASNLTLDLTYNTDFAQVEADNVRINLTRFGLFMPEKREFFVERANLFTFGDRGSTETFFSRRVGLDNDIIGGARLTGEVGRFSVGFLNLQTRDSEDLAGANNTVLRLRTEPLPRTSLGMIFTNLQDAEVSNRVLGVDGVTRFWSSSQVRFWAARGWDSEQGSEDNTAGAGELTLRNDRYGLVLGYKNIGRGFNPGLGFVRRLDQVALHWSAAFTPRFENSSWARSARLSTFGDYIEGQDGRKETMQAGLHTSLRFESGESMGFVVTRDYEHLDETFFIREDVEIPEGEYDFTRVTVFAQTDGSRILSGSVKATFGEFFNGRRDEYGASLDWRQGPRLRLQLSIDRNLISLPIEGGEFSATIVSADVGLAASRKLFGNALIQYDNFSQALQANLRVDWIHTVGSDLFLVFDTGYLLGDLLDPHQARWQRHAGVLKLTYLKTF